MSICSLGIFGTKYERPTSIPTQLKLNKYLTEYVLKVDHIASTYSIGNTLNIKIRIKDSISFPWVSIACYATYCDVKFTNAGPSGN